MHGRVVNQERILFFLPKPDRASGLTSSETFDKRVSLDTPTKDDIVIV